MKNFDISNYKNIAFDIFGVLITEGHVISNALNSILPEDKRGRHVKEYYSELSVGHITEEEFWIRIGIEDWKSFRVKYLDLFETDSYYKNFINSLPNSVNVGIISNVCQEWFDYLDSKFKFREDLGYITISGATTLIKPDKEAYLKYLEITNLKPQDVCFIDDKLSNLIPAKEIGFGTVWFKREEDDTSDFKPDLIINSFKDLL